MNEAAWMNEDEDTVTGKYLTFNLGQEVYGLEISVVTEIVGMQNITEVPDLPLYMKGVINLRGKIIPVIDAGIKFRKPPVAYHERTCIIIMDIDNALIGLIVDKVNEVIDIPEEKVVPPPDGKTGFSNQFIKGIGMIGNDMKLLVDSFKIFSRNIGTDIPSA